MLSLKVVYLKLKITRSLNHHRVGQPWVSRRRITGGDVAAATLTQSFAPFSSSTAPGFPRPGSMVLIFLPIQPVQQWYAATQADPFLKLLTPSLINPFLVPISKARPLSQLVLQVIVREPPLSSLIVPSCFKLLPPFF